MLAQDHIDATTPAGATLLPDGGTFRVWAPRASAVYLNGCFGGGAIARGLPKLLQHPPGLGFSPLARHGFSASATIVIPANGVLVFARQPANP